STWTTVASRAASAAAVRTTTPSFISGGMVSGLADTPAGRPFTSTFTGPAKPCRRLTCTYHAVLEPGPIIALSGSPRSVKSGAAAPPARRPRHNSPPSPRCRRKGQRTAGHPARQPLHPPLPRPGETGQAFNVHIPRRAGAGADHRLARVAAEREIGRRPARLDCV